jgi:hypothetical protein
MLTSCLLLLVVCLLLTNQTASCYDTTTVSMARFAKRALTKRDLGLTSKFEILYQTVMKTPSSTFSVTARDDYIFEILKPQDKLCQDLSQERETRPFCESI